MARVIFSHAQQAHTGVASVQVEAGTFRELKRRLTEQFPGLQAGSLSGAVAIDGEIIAEPLLETLQADSEVHFIPAIEGG